MPQVLLVPHLQCGVGGVAHIHEYIYLYYSLAGCALLRNTFDNENEFISGAGEIAEH